MSSCTHLISHSALVTLTHLCEAAPGPLDGDLALVVDGGPDVDRLAGHVAAPVQPHPTRDRPGGEAGHPQLVLDLTVERLLKISTSNKYSNAFEQSQNVEANLNSICCLSAQFERSRQKEKQEYFQLIIRNTRQKLSGPESGWTIGHRQTEPRLSSGLISVTLLIFSRIHTGYRLGFQMKVSLILIYSPPE